LFEKFFQTPGQALERSSSRFPKKEGQIDPASFCDLHPFGPQQLSLLFKTAAGREGNRPAAVDDPVPWQTVLFRGRMKDAGDLPCRPVVPCQGRDLGVGRYLASGNSFYERFDLTLEFHAPAL
jgi:hypothetical protein